HPVFGPNGDLIEVFGTRVDITERKRAEEERERLRILEADLARINRVTTMGELTASLAHEINQPIAATVMNADTCLQWLAAKSPNIEEAREAAKRIVKDSHRAAEIITRLRSLFKKGSAQREPVHINEVIGEIVMLLRNEAARSRVSIRTELAKVAPVLIGDRVQLQQVVMNLMVNAIDAMKNIDHTRELTVRSQLNGSNDLLVSVSDTGVGLPSETNQLFDAFFTTKPHGTGMGLVISRTIIESHGGRLWASSNSDRGAVFSFTLPISVEEHRSTVEAHA
ncbi:MAG TPA: ATP-binding protein, partial [Terriglobales bacterium]|nr:ATP-binding protein [Terriglobales bacterium]